MGILELIGLRKSAGEIISPNRPFEVIRFTDYSRFDPSTFEGIEISPPVYPQNLTGTSPVDGSNKFAKQIYCCLGLVLVGYDGTREISALPHITGDLASRFYPIKGDKEIAERARADFRTMLSEIKRRSVPGALHAGLVGGNTTRRKDEYYYYSCKKFVRKELDNLGIPFDIINPPNVREDMILDWYLFTQARKIIIVNRLVEEGEVVMD